LGVRQLLKYGSLREKENIPAIVHPNNAADSVMGSSYLNHTIKS